MTEHQSKSSERAGKSGGATKLLSDGEISQLILGSSLSATKPLQGLIMFLVQEGIVDGTKLKAFLEPAFAVESYPPEARAMLTPIWKSLIARISVPDQAGRSNSEGTNDG